MDETLLNTILCEMDVCLESQQEARNAEIARLCASTNPAEHLCGPNCPHLQSIESQRETVDYVCPVSNLTWGDDTKWDAMLAGKCTQGEDRSTGSFSKRSNDVITLTEEIPLPLDYVTTEERETTSRATPRSTRENNLLETHYALRSTAERSIYNTLEHMKPQYREASQIRQDLIVAQEHDRVHHVRFFALEQLNDIHIEAHRRSEQSKHRALLHKHVLQKSVLVEQFVNMLAQLFSTLWIIITHNQIRRREDESFRTFVQSLLNCIHRGMRIFNQPILPRGILFFHDTKRKHRSDSAHHALQQVQQVLGALDSANKTEHFQQCIRLSRQLEVIYEKLINDDFKSDSKEESSSRGKTSSDLRTSGTSCS